MKKKMSRALALLCALMLALALSVPIFAEGEGDATPSGPPYTITLDCQGGTLANEMPHMTDELGRLAVLPSPDREGYIFLGWSLKADSGQGDIRPSTVFTEDTTIYAQWREAPPDEPDEPDNPDNPDNPDDPDKPSDPNGPNGPVYVPPTPDAPSKELLNSENWDVISPEGNGTFAFIYLRPNGSRAIGSYYIERASVKGDGRYLFDRNGILQTGARETDASAPVRVSAEGDVLLNGNLYYLNPYRNVNDPRTCYVMTDYLRVRAGYAGQTYYDKDGITFQGWLKTPTGGLRYQTRIPQPGELNDLYLIVWRAQNLPACQHPDHPGDARYTIPAGMYFFDDDGVLVQKEGWYDGQDGYEYYANASGRVLQQRKKGGAETPVEPVKTLSGEWTTAWREGNIIWTNTYSFIPDGAFTMTPRSYQRGSYSPLTGQVGWYERETETTICVSHGVYAYDGANISLKYLGDNLTAPEDFWVRSETFKIAMDANGDISFDGKRFLKGDFTTNTSVSLFPLCTRLGVSLA